MERQHRPPQSENEAASPVQRQQRPGVGDHGGGSDAAPPVADQAPKHDGPTQTAGAWEADAGLMDAMGLGGAVAGEAGLGGPGNVSENIAPDDAAAATGQAARSKSENPPPKRKNGPAGAPGDPVQRKQSDERTTDDVPETAAGGIVGAGEALPHLDTIQRSFGRHDVAGVAAHTDSAAATANRAMGSEAYATGNDVAFASSSPSLYTAAHEAAHIVQQRGGVQLKGGVGEAGDPWERHADAVADRVVQGKSAEDLLDTVAPSGNSTTRGPGPVQHLMASDIARDHLGAQQRTLTAGQLGDSDPFTGPDPGLELFSGVMTPTFRFRIQPSEELRQAFNPGAAPGESLPGGLQDGAIRDGIVANTRPEISSAAGATFGFGPHGAGNTGSAILRDVADSLYSGGVAAEKTFTGQYLRAAAAEPYQVRGQGSQWAWIRPESVALIGVHGLSTAADGERFVTLASQLTPDPWTQILTDANEGSALAQLVANAAAPSRPPIYNWARNGLFGGDARAWVASASGDQQQALVRNLQHFVRAGIAQATTDLGTYVEAARDVLAAPATPEETKAHVRAALALAPSVDLATISTPGTGSFPADPSATTHSATTDVQFDLFRLAGRAAAESRLLPSLAASLDPIAFIDAYPVESSTTPMVDLMHATVAEANSISEQIVSWINADAQLAIGGTSLTQVDLAREAAKLGEIEAVADWARQVPGDDGLTRMMGSHIAMFRIQQTAQRAAVASAPSHISVNSAANTAAADLFRLTVNTAASSMRRAESRMRTAQRRGNRAEQTRGDALLRYFQTVQAWTIAGDLEALRRASGASTVAQATSATLQDIRGALAGQAAMGQAMSIQAFETAHTRYAADLVRNIEAKIASHNTGEPYVATGLLTIKSFSSLQSLRGAVMDVLAETTTQASRRIKAAGGVAAVIGVAIEVGVFVHNWWARSRITEAKRRILRDAQQQMARFRSNILNDIESRAATEVSEYAAGHVRDGDAFEAYIDALQAGSRSSPGPVVDLNTITEPGELLAIYNNVLQAAALPYNEIYHGMESAVAINGDRLWADYEAQIDALPSVIT